MVDGHLNFDTAVNTSGFNKGVKSLSGELGGLTKSLKAVGVAVSAAFVVKGLISFGKQAISIASDLQEVQNVVDTAFGSMAYKCEEFADTAIEQFGMSKLSAKQTASTYMAMAKSMGLSMDTASDMAVETAKLTGDVASFYNISQDLAATKLKSIFTGETETLKDLGVVMTEDNLKAYALSQGITKSYSAMSQAEKVSLRYNYVMNALTDSQGDFAKTADSWANQTRVLSERWKDLLGILGSGLINALTPAVKMLNSFMQSMINVANVFSQVTAKLFGKQTKISVNSKEVDKAAASESGLAAATKNAGEAAGDSTAAFDKLNVIQQDTGTGGGGSSGAVEATPEIETVTTETEVSTFSSRLEELLKPLQEINFDKLSGSLDKLKEALRPFAQTVGAGLEWFYLNVLVPLAAWTIENVLPLFLDILGVAIEILTGVITAFQPFATWLWDNFLQPIALWTGGIIVTVLTAIKDALTLISDWVNSHGETVRTIIIGIATAFAMWKGIKFLNYVAYIGALTNTTGWLALLNAIRQIAFLGFAPLKTSILKAVGVMKTMSFALLGAIKNAALMTAALVKQTAQLVISIAKWIAATAVTVAHTVATGAATLATTAFGVAMAILTSPITLVVVAITALIAIVVLLVKHWDEVEKTAEKVWDEIKKIWGKASDWLKKNVIDPIKNSFKAGVNFLIGLAEGLANCWVDAVNTIIRALNSISVSIPDWVPGIGGETFGINIPEKSRVKIPRLATGAVIPPNAEFMAMLGDQKHGTNLEAPESLIRQIVREESGGGNVTINATGNMAQLIRLIKFEIDKESKRKGGSLIGGTV